MPAVSISISLRPSTHQRHVDRVAGGAGDLGDDHALLAEEAVDQRGLADVRAADHRQADGARPRARRSRVGQQLHDPVEQIARAETLRGGDRQRLAEAETVELGRQRQLARRRRTCWPRRSPAAGERRSRSAISSSPGRTPARASTTSTATCASARPARACSRIEPASGSSSAKSTPPVSISLNRRPFHSQSSSLRSRVTPGRSCTTASRVPVRRLIERGLAHVGIADDGDLQHWASMTGLARGSGPLPAAGRLGIGLALRLERCLRAPDASAGDALDDLLHVQAGGVERDRAGGRLQGAVLARGVALVAQRLLGEHAARTRRPARPPAGARALRRSA